MQENRCVPVWAKELNEGHVFGIQPRLAHVPWPLVLQRKVRRQQQPKE
jgi:hypothetical protein